jgi:hypothetical protein
MSDTRKTDAAIALIGLGKVFPHEGVEGVCKECGHDIHQDKVCYAKVPHYETDILAASDLLSIIFKEAPHGIEVKWNGDAMMFELRYKGATPLEDMVFMSATSQPAIKSMAMYHFNINPEEVCAVVANA